VASQDDTSVNEDNYLRVERTYGSFSRKLSLPGGGTRRPSRRHTTGAHGDSAKREESKPKQVKVNIQFERNGR